VKLLKQRYDQYNTDAITHDAAVKMFLQECGKGGLSYAKG